MSLRGVNVFLAHGKTQKSIMELEAVRTLEIKMDKSIKLIYLEVALIVILIIVNVALNNRMTDFNRDCKVTYNLSGECPCVNHLFNVSIYSNLTTKNLNFTNFTFG